jgi:hypothetical protein
MHRDIYASLSQPIRHIVIECGNQYIDHPGDLYPYHHWKRHNGRPHTSCASHHHSESLSQAGIEAKWLPTKEMPQPTVKVNMHNICHETSSGKSRHHAARQVGEERVGDSLFGPASLSLAILLIVVVWPPLTAGQNPVLTYHADNARTGQFATETVLTPANVNSKQFGKLFSYGVDGFIVAQPLYVPNVMINGVGNRNVVFVATQHDSVYAFDSDHPGSGVPLWHVGFVNAEAGVTTVPISEQLCPGTGFSEMGIMGTPVIEVGSGTLYVSVKTREVIGSTVTYVHRLHALDIRSGQEKFGGPVVITGFLVAPNGNSVNFNSLPQCQRPGLLLSNGVLFIAYGSNGCDLAAHGWIFAYNATSLQQLAIFNTSPNQSFGASIWQGGTGLAADANGNIFFATANGAFDVNSGGPDFGDSIVKLAFSGAAFTWMDYFTPFDQANMDTQDLDLGSGGAILLPDQVGAHPHLLVQAGKTGSIYLVDRDSMGQFNSASNSIVQTLPSAVGPVFGGPVYWNGNVYFAAYNDAIKAFSLTNDLLSSTATIISKKIPVIGVSSISANGSSNGILWIVRNPTSPMLSAFNATTLTELYNSSQAAARDTLGAVPKFIAPMIANGRVYIGGQSQLVVYGLFPSIAVTGGNNQSATVATILPAPLSVQVRDSTNTGVQGVTVTFSDGGKGGTFSTPTATTLGTGSASVNYTLPIKSGGITITVSAPGYTAATLTETGTPGTPTAITVVSGSAQTATVGTMLPLPIVVRPRDTYNNGVPGLSISFSDNAAAGSFSANPVITDSTGKAIVSYTLPTAAKSIVITATYATLKLNISEKAVAGTPTSLSIAAGNNQAASPSTLLPNPLAVLVQDRYGNPVANVMVNFADGGAGGTFSTPSAATAPTGRATVNYTTPSTTGTVSISATVSGLTPVTFTETVR